MSSGHRAKWLAECLLDSAGKHAPWYRMPGCAKSDAWTGYARNQTRFWNAHSSPGCFYCCILARGDLSILSLDEHYSRSRAVENVCEVTVMARIMNRDPEQIATSMKRDGHLNCTLSMSLPRASERAFRVPSPAGNLVVCVPLNFTFYRVEWQSTMPTQHRRLVYFLEV